MLKVIINDDYDRLKKELFEKSNPNDHEQNIKMLANVTEAMDKIIEVAYYLQKTLKS